ncbi:hypothetical protein FALBO_14297 [Fusarium albosuccineum]|uniref:Uncharacterized protein n=1 Tax=Fusarium albosuccineum TaxID=1237068 RepID=A0A8H4L0Q3_9HYPO|nr:hypothetical protein FALBO_14297 [Fusarium albosuccineum]
MFVQHLFAGLAFLSPFLGTVLAAECTNITIVTADHADRIRKSCKTITGSLNFDGSLNETINLDGIETVDGNMMYYPDHDDRRHWELGDPYPTDRSTFKIHSSTLKTINGAVYFWDFQGLEELSFPNLTRVEQRFGLRRMHYLKTLDITNLAYLGEFNIEAIYLTTLRHDGLKGFTNSTDKYHQIKMYGLRVESIDSWFWYPLTVDWVYEFNADPATAPSPIDIHGYSLPNLKNVTIGWSKVSNVKIQGDIDVTFGGSETEEVEIDFLLIYGNTTKIQRDPDLKKLEVGELIVTHSFAKEVDLSALDQVTNLTFTFNQGLQGVRVGPKATEWKNVSVVFDFNQNVNLTSEYRDPENEKDRFWYWPEGEMRSIVITGTPVTNDFFESFLEHRNGSDAPKVSYQFDLQPGWYEQSIIDCTPFEELRNRSVLPEYYGCKDKESSASITRLSWAFTAVAFLISALHFL